MNASYGHAHARHLIGGRGLAVELPVHQERLGEDVAQKAEARHDHRVAILIRLDVDHRHGQHVATLGTVDRDRPGHRMDQVEIERRQVVGDRIERQIRIERIARVEHDVIAGLAAVAAAGIAG